MALVVQDDIDIGARGTTSTPGTPSSHVRRQLSEPPQPQSNPIQDTPGADASRSVKCLWCGEGFEASTAPGAISPAEALRQHMWDAHPNVAKFSLVDQDPNNEIASGESALDEAAPLDSLQQLSRHNEAIDVERRLSSFWNVDNVHQFTDDYDGEDDGIPELWKEEFDAIERPKAYETEIVADGKFLPITKSEIYTDILKNPETLSTEKLYAITANTAHALKIWQDEYLAIDKLTKRATRNSLKKTSNPRKFEDPQVFEDKKEAALYGYKYDAKESRIGCQDPFIQGGFKPTPTQLKKMKANNPKSRNIDGWAPTVINGVEYIPGMRQPEKPVKRKAADIDVGVNGIGETEYEENGRPKRITRFGGFRNPQTRETSQAATEPSSPVTAAPTPVPTPAPATRGRRPRRPISRGMSTTPQLTIPPPALATATAPTLAYAPSPIGQPVARGATEVPITKSTSPTAPRSQTRASTPVYENPLLDPKNQLKIQQSKNPKRTEAMIIHWAKFNSEGRTRNPKRTKAQIEADRAEAEKRGDTSKTTTGGGGGVKRRRVGGDAKTVGTAGRPSSMPTKISSQAETLAPVQTGSETAAHAHAHAQTQARAHAHAHAHPGNVIQPTIEGVPPPPPPPPQYTHTPHTGYSHAHQFS
ncbi:hypothetical protein AJ80_07547 [Polytolypa hystricis UAMH7299]|uniref:Uncharacterized protein n=1 Tax=Polytolypa hystricis (strain UAMH7299) TaxID=1447883 RepID=A0A2B7XNL0_POLH7|nr:hypothetical protein AJ80_07547 [Polytolypa hystricis UAMH7299]